VDADRTAAATLVACAPHLSGLRGLSMSFTKLSESDIVEIARNTGAHELWLVHSVSQRTIRGVVAAFRGVPRLTAIHVGTDVAAPTDSPIPFIVETE